MALLIGCLIGLVLGLTGAGGSVFAVPLLVLALGLPVQMAAGLSLGAVSVAATLGVLLRLRSSQIQWLPALVFALAGALAAPFGGLLAPLLGESVLLTSFSLLVWVIALRMWQQAAHDPDFAREVRAQSGPNRSAPDKAAVCGEDALSLDNFRWICFVRIVSAAILTGVLSGLYGVGGGFIIVPVLVSLLRMGIREAVATSLLVITVISGAGFISFASRVTIPVELLHLLALGGIVGMFAGMGMSRLIAGPGLQKLFAVMMVVLSIVMLLQRMFGLS